MGLKARLYELDHGKRITVRAASKLLADIAFQYRGSGLGMVGDFSTHEVKFRVGVVRG